VGKSTLFNRLIGKNRAITHDRPGVTRDRMEGEVRRGGAPFVIVDTGGVGLDETGRVGTGPERLKGFEAEVLDQARQALGQCDGLLLVLDGREGLSPVDRSLADFLRQSGKPVLAAVNKVDGEELEERFMPEFYALGLDIVPVSAEHGHNVDELVARIRDILPEPEEEESETEADESETGLRLAVLGRPNAGKSSIINALFGQSRMIVSDIPGTTVDSVDVTLEYKGKRYTIVDTAGVRRRTRIDDPLERYSVQSALKSAKKAQCAVFVMDAALGVSTQDKKLLSYLDREKIPFMVAVNKTDLVPKGGMAQLRRTYSDELNLCPHAPVIYVSALKRKGLDKIFALAEEIWREGGVRIGTGQLNRAMTGAITKHQPPVVKRRRAKFYYVTQADTRPPTFVFFVNDPERVKPSYARYLENQLRKTLEIRMSPIRVLFRPSHSKED